MISTKKKIIYKIYKRYKNATGNSSGMVQAIDLGLLTYRATNR